MTSSPHSGHSLPIGAGPAQKRTGNWAINFIHILFIFTYDSDEFIARIRTILDTKASGCSVTAPACVAAIRTRADSRAWRLHSHTGHLTRLRTMAEQEVDTSVTANAVRRLPPPAYAPPTYTDGDGVTAVDQDQEKGGGDGVGLPPSASASCTNEFMTLDTEDSLEYMNVPPGTSATPVVEEPPELRASIYEPTEDQDQEDSEDDVTAGSEQQQTRVQISATSHMDSVLVQHASKAFGQGRVSADELAHMREIQRKFDAAAAEVSSLAVAQLCACACACVHSVCVCVLACVCGS